MDPKRNVSLCFLDYKITIDRVLKQVDADYERKSDPFRNLYVGDK